MEAEDEMEYGIPDIDWVWLLIHTCGRKKRVELTKEVSQTMLQAHETLLYPTGGPAVYVHKSVLQWTEWALLISTSR